MAKITAPNRDDRHIRDDGKPDFQFADWIEAVSQAVNNLEPLTGSGSPAGVVSAAPGRWYVNTSAAAGTGVYFKESGTGNTGWVLRS